jgi:hypothetical protein
MARQMLQGGFQLKWLFGEVYHTFLSHGMKVGRVGMVARVKRRGEMGFYGIGNENI